MCSSASGANSVSTRWRRWRRTWKNQSTAASTQVSCSKRPSPERQPERGRRRQPLRRLHPLRQQRPRRRSTEPRRHQRPVSFIWQHNLTSRRNAHVFIVLLASLLTLEGGGSGGRGDTGATNSDLLLKESVQLPRKLVRGQDVWLGKGAEQTRQILKVSTCHCYCLHYDLTTC